MEFGQNPDARISDRDARVPLVRRNWFLWLFCLALVCSLFASKVFTFFSSAPVLYLTLRQGPLAGLGLFLVAALLFMPTQPLDSSVLLLGLGLGSWMFGLGLRRNWSVARSLSIAIALVTSLVVIVLSLGPVLFPHRLTHLPGQWWGEVAQNLDQIIRQVQDVNEQGEGARSLLRTEEDRLLERQNFVQWTGRLLPGLSISMISISLWMYLVLLRPAAKQLQIERAYEDLPAWRSPYPLVWAVIAGLALVIWTPPPSLIVAANILIVLAAMYLFQGVAVLVHFMKRQEWSAMVRLAFYSFAVLFLKPVALMLVCLGFFDVWFNFRKLKEGVA